MTQNQIRAMMYGKLASLAFARAKHNLNVVQSADTHPLVRLVASDCYVATYIQGRKLADKATRLGLPFPRVFAR